MTGPTSCHDRDGTRKRVLVVGVGNVLRGDDGFGVAVARRLSETGNLPVDVDVIETGIGGMSIVHQLMDGYRTLIVVDAVDQGAEPGTVFVFEPEVVDAAELGAERWQALFSNLHLAEPSRVFALAHALGILPEQLLIVGCQPESCDELDESLSAPVAAAVPIACDRVRTLVASQGEGAASMIATSRSRAATPHRKIRPARTRKPGDRVGEDRARRVAWPDR